MPRRATQRRRLELPAVIRRLPRPIWWRPDPDSPWPDDWPVISAGADAEYPQLADDFRLWHSELERPFRRLDHEAQLLQHSFWRQNLALILGGFVATVLGAVQSASGGGHHGLAVLQALLTALLAGLTALVHVRRPLRGYLTTRLKAERIKSEFFLFLGQVGEYAGAEREERLRRRVVDITDTETAG